MENSTKTSTPTGHPCFNPDVRHSAARVHLPVIRECNVQCRFCNRLFDCVNETRPGVTSALLTPHQAVEYLRRCIDGGMPVSVAGIAGPGDAFAQPEATLETLSLVKKHFPQLLLCVATNGLAAEAYVPELARLGVTHVSVTVNGVEAAIVGRIYAWARYNRRMLRGDDMAACIIERQAATIRALVKHGITVKVNSIVIPGVNDHHVETVAATVAGYGATLFNCIPLLPTAGPEFETINKPDHELMQSLRWKVSRILPIMQHCAHCRADAAGLIGKDDPVATGSMLAEIAAGPRNPAESRPHIAVTSREGVFINEHLGSAGSVNVYRLSNGAVELLDTRVAPPPGGGDERWATMAAQLADCRTLLTYRCGTAPRRILESSGLSVIETEGFIDDALHTLFNGKTIATRPAPLPCGQGCTGNGGGCG
jgi:nitrogen fixation protein NifB